MMGRFNRPHRSNRIPAFIKMGWVQPPHFSVSKVAICSFGIKIWLKILCYAIKMTATRPLTHPIQGIIIEVWQSLSKSRSEKKYGS